MLHPCVTSSSPLAALSRHVPPALFVCLSVRLFVWLVVALSLCPMLLLPVPLHCHATSLYCVTSLVVPLVLLLSGRRVVASSRRPIFPSLGHRVSSCLVVVSRPLTHLVMPALFDCCIVALHIVITARSVLLSLSYCCHRRVVA